MGKLKKRQRIEKAKVKLKKKQLLKAQNVTDTSFKVRKIVIPTQLKEVSGNEPVSKRKQNIKELTSRLKHHNDSARQGALAGLREVLSQHTDDVLTPHFLAMAQALAEMIVVEGTTKIRREALKLLQAILSQVPSEKIAPFFKILLWHLTCAMTHINSQIQEDSLFMFDILLSCAPHLMALAVPDLLPTFLNMISKLCAESRPGRTITLDLGSSVTTVRWRGEVLARVQSFLRAVVHCRDSENLQKTAATMEPHVYHWKNNGPVYAPAYLRCHSKLCELPNIFRRTVVESAHGDGTNPRSYAQELMPLLFETWLEVRPATLVDKKAEVNQEAGQLLMLIVDIMQLLYTFMSQGEHEDAKREEMRAWFAVTYREDFNRYIVADFPFSQGERMAAKVRDEQQGSKNIPQSMQLANLTICYLFLVLNTVHSDSVVAKVAKYIKRSLLQWHVLDELSREQLLKVLRFVLLDKHSGVVHFSSAVLRYLTATCLRLPQESKLFQLLCELADNRNPDSTKVLVPWLATLPQLLCQPEVPCNIVKCLSHLACQRTPAFWDAFVKNLPCFIRNLGAVKVSGDEFDGRLRLAGMLYWVPQWNTEEVELLQRESERWEPALTSYIKELIVK